MTESDRLTVAEILQNGTAMSRLTHGEIVSALEFLESAGYDVIKKPVYEEQTFSLPALAEEPELPPSTLNEKAREYMADQAPAAVEGEDHAA